MQPPSIELSPRVSRNKILNLIFVSNSSKFSERIFVMIIFMHSAKCASQYAGMTARTLRSRGFELAGINSRTVTLLANPSLSSVRQHAEEFDDWVNFDYFSFNLQPTTKMTSALMNTFIL